MGVFDLMVEDGGVRFVLIICFGLIVVLSYIFSDVVVDIIIF